MARPYDRPATLVALVNAVVVLLLPMVVAQVVTLFANDFGNGSTTVQGSLPPGEHYARQLRFVAGYIGVLSPFATAAAFRTFVHAKRWLECGASGWIGVLEAGLCGFAGAFLVLLPGLVTHSPVQSIPYLLAYGGITFIVGLGAGVVLWCTATLALYILGPEARATSLPQNNC